MFCSLCDHEPYKAITFREVLEGELLVLDDWLDTSKKRNHLYRTYVRAKHQPKKTSKLHVLAVLLKLKTTVWLIVDLF